jgi:hypothetical protein
LDFCKSIGGLSAPSYVGFECADLSPSGSRQGLHGIKSSTFYPLLSILASLQRMRISHYFPLAFVIENTATQYALGSSNAMKYSFHELCDKIGVPVVLDAANVGSYAHRIPLLDKPCFTFSLAVCFRLF